MALGSIGLVSEIRMLPPPPAQPPRSHVSVITLSGRHPGESRIRDLIQGGGAPHVAVQDPVSQARIRTMAHSPPTIINRHFN